MDARWVARGQPNGNIVLRDRWTLEVKHTVRPPPSIYGPHDRPLLICVQLSDRYLAAVYADYRGTCVWDLSGSLDLVQHIYDDGWAEFELDGIVHNHPVSFNMTNCIRLHGNHLLAVGHVSTPQCPAVQSLAIISHRIGEEEHPVRQTVNGPATLVNIGLDDQFAVILLETHAGPGGNPPPGDDDLISRYEVQIRSPDTLQHLRSVHFKSSRYCYFDYLDGVMVTGLAGNNIRVWNVATGHCIRNLLNEGPLTAVR